MFDEFLDHEAVRLPVVAFVFEFEEFGERIWILDFLVGFAVEILFAFEEAVDAVGVEPVLALESVDFDDAFDVFALVAVHGLFVFVGTPWCVVVLDFVLLRPRTRVGEMVFARCKVTADFLDDHFALVLLLRVALDEAVWLFLLAEQFDPQLLPVEHFVAVRTQFQQLLAVEVQRG